MKTKVVLKILIFLLAFASCTTSFGSSYTKNNGLTAKTAYEVYSIAHEYEILSLLNLKPTKQTLMLIDNEYYDLFEIKGKKIYFKFIKKEYKNHILL